MKKHGASENSTRANRDGEELSDTGQTARDDARVFLEAMRDVTPLGSGKLRRTQKASASRPPAVVSEDAEVIAHLRDLVVGRGEFDITETEEYVEGARVGLDLRLLSRLRKGEFARQAHLDLHGLAREPAREALAKFIRESVARGRRSVLVVTGRGRRSPGGESVLRRATVEWLSRGPISPHVLAFSTARPADGGTGAFYVLLRRNRRRGAFDVLNGASRCW